jgi:hypothetical protein
MPKAKPKPPPKKKAKRPTRVPPKPTKRYAKPIPKKARDTMPTQADEANDVQTMKERRAQLLKQAEDNEAANDEAYEKQVDANMQFAAKMEKANDPDERDKADAAAQKAQQQAKPKSSPTTADFKQGQAAG